jgi:hypothetical protein
MDSMIDCEATSMPGSRPELARSRSSGCPFLDSERTRPVVQLLGEPDFESVAAFTAVDRQPPGSSGFMKSETRRLTIEPDPANPRFILSVCGEGYKFVG